jgi:density-regulated protein
VRALIAGAPLHLLRSLGTDVDLKKATKQFANKFACGCSAGRTVTGQSEVVVQGDVVDDLVAFIVEEWPSVRGL